MGSKQEGQPKTTGDGTSRIPYPSSPHLLGLNRSKIPGLLVCRVRAAGRPLPGNPHRRGAPHLSGAQANSAVGRLRYIIFILQRIGTVPTLYN